MKSSLFCHPAPPKGFPDGSIAIALIGVFVCVCAPVFADWPKPIVPPKTDAPAPVTGDAPGALPAPIAAPTANALPGAITAPGVNALPKTVTTPGAVALPGTIAGTPTAPGATPADAHRAQLPSLIERMTDGQITPQQAWADKLLTADDLFWIFTSYVGDWGNLGTTKNVPVRRALEELLVQNGGEKLQSPDTLPPTVRLWLADYYQSLGDAKCVDLCESVLREIKTPVRGENALIFQTVERIAWLQRDRHEMEKAAQTWLRMANYHAESGWWLPDAQIEAARHYRLAGNERRADELYGQLVKSGPAFFASGALKENTAALIKQGKTAEAQRELEVLLAQSDGKAEPKYVAALSVLGGIHYQKGDWAQAAKFYTEAVAQSQKLPASGLTVPDIAVLNNAEAMLHIVAQWQAQHMTCDPPEINVVAGSEKKDAPVTRRFLVSTPQDVPVEVGSSDPQIKVLRVEDSPWQSDAQPLRFEKQVVVEISAEALQKELSATLTLRSAKLPGFQASVPLRVQMRTEQP